MHFFQTNILPWLFNIKDFILSCIRPLVHLSMQTSTELWQDFSYLFWHKSTAITRFNTIHTKTFFKLLLCWMYQFCPRESQLAQGNFLSVPYTCLQNPGSLWCPKEGGTQRSKWICLKMSYAEGLIVVGYVWVTEKSNASMAESGLSFTDVRMPKHPAFWMGFLPIWPKTNIIKVSK